MKGVGSEEEELSDDDEIGGAGSGVDAKGKGRQPDDGEDEMGSEGPGGRVMPSSSLARIGGGPGSFDSQGQLGNQIHHKGSTSSGLNADRQVPDIAHLSFALVRYATGQILEDEFAISDYSLEPHELIELHLSISPPSPDHPAAVGFIPPSSTFPFPLLAAPSTLMKSKSKKKKREGLAALVAPHAARLVHLPRSLPEAYATPYWEGWIRILRFACRDEDEYLYGGHLMPPPSSSSFAKSTSSFTSSPKYPPSSKSYGKQKLVPGYAQYGGSFGLSSGGSGFGGGSGNSVFVEPRERDLDAELAHNFGFVGLGSSSTHKDRGRGTGGGDGSGGFAQMEGSRSRFEWRQRWLIIRDGWIFLLKDRGVRLSNPCFLPSDLPI